MWATRCRTARATSPRSRAASAPDPEGRRRGRARAGRGRSGRCSTPGRACTTPRPGTSSAARGAAGGAGHHQPRGQERVPGEPPAVAGLGRALAAGALYQHFVRVGRDLRRRLPASRRPTTASSSRRNRTYIHATLDPRDLNKDLRASYGAARRRRAHARDAASRRSASVSEQAARQGRAVATRSAASATSGCRSGCRSSPTHRRRSRPTA